VVLAGVVPGDFFSGRLLPVHRPAAPTQVGISLACRWQPWEVACSPQGVQPWAFLGGPPGHAVSLAGRSSVGLACSMVMLWQPTREGYGLVGWPSFLVVFFMWRIHVGVWSCRRGRPCDEQQRSLVCCWHREALRLSRWHAGVMASSRCA
jgi:hypothetical protein